MSKLRNSQEEINDSILTLMCLTFNKKRNEKTYRGLYLNKWLN